MEHAIRFFSAFFLIINNVTNPSRQFRFLLSFVNRVIYTHTHELLAMGINNVQLLFGLVTISNVCANLIIIVHKCTVHMD